MKMSVGTSIFTSHGLWRGGYQEMNKLLKYNN